jgi:hypothetical protein
MADFTNSTEELILDWWGNLGSPTRPSAHWIALFNTTPTADDGTGGTENSNSGYARQSVTWVRSAQTLNPTATVTFGPAGEAWAQVNGFGVFTLVTGGTLMAFEDLTTARTLGNGDSAEFATADLSITLD